MNYSDLEAQYSLPTGILDSIRNTESSGGKYRLSDAGALGDFQFLPSTAKAYGINPLDPSQAADGAARMLSDLGRQYKGNWQAAIAHYNGGGAAGKAVMSGQQPPSKETQAYIPKVMAGVSQAKPMSLEDAANVLGLAQQTAPAAGQSAQDAARILGLDQAAPSNSDRVFQGMKDPIDAGAQLLTKILPGGVVSAGNRLNNWLADKTGLVGRLPEGGVDEQVKQTNDKFKTDGIDWYRLGGNIASPANIAAAARVPGLASRIPLLSGVIGKGVATGVVNGLLTPTTGDDYWSDKAKQVALSSVVGGVVPAATGAVSRVISPKASLNPDVLMLKAEGVTPTIGQTLGGRANALEEKLTSVPIVGDAISGARRAAQEQFNKAAINRAVAPIGEAVDDVGQTGIKRAGDLLSSAYDDALSKIKYVKFDSQFSNDLGQLQSMAGGLEPKFQAKFGQLLSDKLGTRMSGTGSMMGDNFKKVVSDLGDESRRFEGLTNSAAVDYSKAVKQLQNLMQQQVGRGANPDAANLMKAADKGWSNLVRLEGASTAAKNTNGVFTPGQLNQAVRQADSSVRDRATARGTALMQDLGTAGQNVLGNKVPNSFTTDRALIAGGSLFSGAINPLIPASLLGGAALYSSPAQKLLGGLLTSRPNAAAAIAQGVKGSAPYFIPIGSPLTSGLINYQN